VYISSFTSSVNLSHPTTDRQTDRQRHYTEHTHRANTHRDNTHTERVWRERGERFSSEMAEAEGEETLLLRCAYAKETHRIELSSSSTVTIRKT
jgi:hypothetical protein